MKLYWTVRTYIMQATFAIRRWLRPRPMNNAKAAAAIRDEITKMFLDTHDLQIVDSDTDVTPDENLSPAQIEMKKIAAEYGYKVGAKI